MARVENRFSLRSSGCSCCTFMVTLPSALFPPLQVLHWDLAVPVFIQKISSIQKNGKSQNESPYTPPRLSNLCFILCALSLYLSPGFSLPLLLRSSFPPFHPFQVSMFIKGQGCLSLWSHPCPLTSHCLPCPLNLWFCIYKRSSVDLHANTC